MPIKEWAIKHLPYRKVEQYVAPNREEVKNSLISMRNVLHIPRDKYYTTKEGNRVKIFLSDVVLFSSVDKKIQSTAEFYRELSKAAWGRNADLLKEAPDIIDAIKKEYATPDPHDPGPPKQRPPFEFITELFDQEIEHISLAEQSPAIGE